MCSDVSFLTKVKLLHASHLPPEFELCHCTIQFTILFHIYVMPFAAKHVDLPFEAENVDVWDALQKQGPACKNKLSSNFILDNFKMKQHGRGW